MALGRNGVVLRLLRFLALLVMLLVTVLILARSQSASLVCPFELEAPEQWIIRQDRPGQIAARHTQGRRQAVQTVQVYQFGADDFVTLRLVSNLTEGANVVAGTPVMEVSSINDAIMERMLIARTNRLTLELAQLRQPDIDDATTGAVSRLDEATHELQMYRALIDRRSNLVEQGYVSADELQLMELEYARRRLSASARQMQSGYQRLRLRGDSTATEEAELEETLQQLQLVQQRLASRWLITPISGRLTRSSGVPEVLVRVVNEDPLVARILAPVEHAHHLSVGADVELVFSGYNSIVVQSRIEQMSIEPDPLLGISVIHMLAPVDNTNNRFTIGMSGQARLRSVRINPFLALWREIKLVLATASGKNTVTP